MRKRICLITLLIILFCQISCFSDSDKISNLTNEVSVFTVSNESLNSIETKLSDSSKFSIYKSLITYIAKEGEYPRKTNAYVLFYLTKTIDPQNIEKIKENPSIKPTLVDSFTRSNQKPEFLEKNYDILTVSVDSNSGDRDLAKFYEATKRKYPETSGVVAFSNIGIDDTEKEGLVYVEFYGSDKKLRKMYLQMSFYKDEYTYDPNEIQGVLNFNSIEIK